MATKSRKITIIRTILASPSRVFHAFTTADGWCEWCAEKAEVDTTIRGKLHIYTQGYNAYGEFRVLEQDRKIAFTWDGDGEPPTVIHISLDEQADGTKVTFKVIGLCPEQDWAKFSETLKSIWGRVLDNLKAVLEAKQEA